MPALKETLRVYDSKKFHYDVTVNHAPHFGYSTAYYKGSIVATHDHQKLHTPDSDDDREWEMYEDSFAEWRDEVLSNIKQKATRYFDNL